MGKLDSELLSYTEIILVFLLSGQRGKKFFILSFFIQVHDLVPHEAKTEASPFTKCPNFG